MPFFPTAYWPFLDADATFLPGMELPPESEGQLWAVLVFVFYGDKVALADIAGRGWCIPSGRIEAGETVDAAAERECREETGARLHPQHRALIGCYRLAFREGKRAGDVLYCPVLAAEALGFSALPDGSESDGLLLAAIEDVADLYFYWDELMAAVFEYAEAERGARFPFGTPLASLTGP